VPGAFGWGKVIVFIWTIFPPVFFWLDWVYFCGKANLSETQWDRIRHTHDLAQNIWLGLPAVLAFSFFHVTS
jgi:hypothetical protein